MTKNLKLKIKSTQLAKSAGLEKLKAKLSGEKSQEDEAKKLKAAKKEPKEKVTEAPVETEEGGPRRVRAKSKSAFAKEEESAAEFAHEESAEGTSTPIEESISETIIETPSVEEVITEKLPPSEPVTPVKAPEPPKRVFSPDRLGPTGRHVKDLVREPKPVPKTTPRRVETPPRRTETPTKKFETPVKKVAEVPKKDDSDDKKGLKKGKKVRDFKDVSPPKKQPVKTFDARDRQGLSEGDDARWRKRRPLRSQGRSQEELEIARPSELSIRLPIILKELAVEMKVKAAEIIQKLFLQGMVYTVNDVLEDETVVQYIGEEFKCKITIDSSEEKRIQITAQTIREEIKAEDPEKLRYRPPVVAFMGHVDHGKTSLIDAIRKSDIAGGEAGAITQHIGAFCCKTQVGDITILDTPGHEAFSAMRARGAEVTDIVVLVVAGDEGLREQTHEAIQHAKAAGVTIVVAINKCDKPNFNVENVYRELSELELLPESWGGSTITVNTSAVTKQGIPELLEMLALQAEVLELKANPESRARGTVLESQLHKGMGNVATVLVQNGTLNHGDAVVFERDWGRIKTMQDEHGLFLQHAGPSAPVEITGLSGLPSAGDPFIVVKSEKEARHIVETRKVGRDQRALQQRKLPTMEKFLQDGEGGKKILKLILRADVQGSAEALRTSILKIHSDKARADVIFLGVGEISESDVQLAAASNAIIIGFHTAIESHAEPLIKELGVKVKIFDIIYHALDEVKNMMLGMLDKIAEEKETGTAEVKATFKSSHLGVIAGCLVTSGSIIRNNRARVVRAGEVIWKGGFGSLKREKEDVKEVKKGFECGILLEGFTDIKEGDIIQAYEITYRTQEL